MLMKKPRHRIFDYTPRFYDPGTDPAVKKKRRLGFSKKRKYNNKRKSPVIWLVLVLLLVYLILKLQHLF